MSRKIHVFLFLHDLAPFGAQRVLFNIAKYLDKEAFRLTVCSFWGDETLAEEFRACGAEVIFLRARRYLDPVAWLMLARELFSRRPDIVKTSMPELSVPVRLLGMFIPGLQVVHCVENPFSSEPVYWRLANRATLCLCGAVVFCSKGLLAEVSPLSGCVKDRALVVQNGIDAVPWTGETTELRAELGAGPGDTLICFAARLARQKGQDILIEAVARLARQGRAVKLALAGDGEDLGELQDLVRRLGISDRVLFLGRRGDVPRILAACDIYASAARWEGLSLSLCEAMLAGKPCAATSIPGHTDILTDKVTGLAVPPEDPELLAKAVASLLDDPAGAARMAAAGRELILSGFTSEAMSRKYADVYFRLAGGAGK